MPVRGRPTGLGAGGNRGPPARNSRGQGAAVSGNISFNYWRMNEISDIRREAGRCASPTFSYGH